MDNLTPKYRMTFDNFDGDVLENILFDVCKLGQPFKSDDKLAVAGVALAFSIIERTGFNFNNEEHRKAFTRMLLSVPLKLQEE